VASVASVFVPSLVSLFCVFFVAVVAFVVRGLVELGRVVVVAEQLLDFAGRVLLVVAAVILEEEVLVGRRVQLLLVHLHPGPELLLKNEVGELV
jgi:hypothetical protein